MLPRLLAYDMLPQLLREQIIDRAIEPITCSADETTEAVQRFFEQQGIYQDSAYAIWLKRYSMAPTQLEFAATRPLRIEKFKTQMWQHHINSYFLQRKDRLDRIIYSCVRVKDGSLANELYYRLREGEQVFSELARDYSEGPEALTGGVIGPTELGCLPQPLAQILRASQARQLRGPIPFATCFLILRVEKMIPAQLDESMRNQLIGELFEAWLQQQTNMPNG